MNMTQMMALVSVAVYCAQGVIAWIYFCNLYQRKLQKRILLTAIIIGYGLLYTASLTLEPWAAALLFFPVNLAILKACFQSSWKSSIFHTAYLTVIMVLSDQIVTLVISAVTGDYNAYSYRLSAFVTLSIFGKLVYFFLMIFSLGAFLSYDGKQEDSRNVLILCVVPLASMLILITFQVVGISGYVTPLMETMLSWSAAALLIANIVVVFIYNRIRLLHAENTALQMGQLRDKADTEYYELLQKQYDSQQILIHNIKNHLHVIAMQAEQEHAEGVLQYVQSMQTVPELNICTRICSHPILNMILLDYRRQCRANDIGFHCDIRCTSLNRIDDICITSLFGNLLSNAVEAAGQSERKDIRITVLEKQ